MGQLIDMSSTIQFVYSKEKEKALNLLSKFDIEYSKDTGKVKHYPLDDYSTTGTDEDIAKRVQRMSKVLWHTVAGYIEKELPITVPVYDDGLLKPMNWDERPVKAKKIGKIYTCGPTNTFATVPVSVVQPYLFSHTEGDQVELMGEINFGIEIY